jgi:predicted nuclease of predicted toxin-antitoxin system
MSLANIRFLADESCDFAVVRALRSEGYDVLAISERGSRSIDSELLEQAAIENRILVTEDKDFGRLVYSDEDASAGVLLIRFPGNARSKLAKTIVDLIRDRGDELLGAMTVVQPSYVRIRREQRE